MTTTVTSLSSYFVQFTLFDAAILAAYLVALMAFKGNRLEVLKCLAPFAVYFFTYKSEQSQQIPSLDIYAYALYSSLYILLAHHFFKSEKYHIAVPLLLMSFYDAVYSFDSWINNNVNTWIWHNHAHIICILHAFILLVFSKRFCSVVDACIDNISNTISNRLHCGGLKKREGSAPSGEKNL